MNVVLLSPEFPSNYFRFCVRLRETGATALAVGQNPPDSLRRELRDSLHDYVCVPDLHRYEDILRAFGYLTWRHGKIDRVDSHNEHWLATEARLRDDFNIEGPRIADLPGVKKKSEMKDLFRAAGLAVAKGHLYRDAESAMAFAAGTGFPLVAKPDSGVGANATFVLNSESEFLQFLQECAEGYFLEEYIPGHIQTFDGLADSSGHPVFLTSLEYRGTLQMVLDEIDTSYYTLRDIPDDLMEAGSRVLKAFNIRGRFFHIEFFRRPDGLLVALEVNLRPAGGLSLDMFNFSSDTDLYARWAQVVTGTGSLSPVGRPYHCAYVGRKSYKRYVHSHDEVFARCGNRLAAHQPMDPVFHRAMGDYAYLVRSPILEEIHELTEFIHLKHP